MEVAGEVRRMLFSRCQNSTQQDTDFHRVNDPHFEPKKVVELEGIMSDEPFPPGGGGGGGGPPVDKY